MKEREIKIGAIYKHFKGKSYRVLGVAENTETGQKLVVYRALYGDSKVWARPLDMFLGDVDTNKYPDAIQKERFKLVEF